MGGIKEVRTLKELVQYGAAQYGEHIAFQYKKKKENVEISYQDFYQDINALGSYLYNSNIKQKKVAIIGENSYQWLVTFFAVANSRA